METIIIETEDKVTTQRIKDFLDTLKVKYTSGQKGLSNEKNKEQPYDPAFIKMVMERTESAKKGHTITIDPENVWGSLGLK